MTLQICVLCALGALALIADGLSVRRDGTKGARPGNPARPRSGLAPLFPDICVGSSTTAPTQHTTTKVTVVASRGRREFR